MTTACVIKFTSAYFCNSSPTHCTLVYTIQCMYMYMYQLDNYYLYMYIQIENKYVWYSYMYMYTTCTCSITCTGSVPTYYSVYIVYMYFIHWCTCTCRNSRKSLIMCIFSHVNIPMFNNYCLIGIIFPLYFGMPTHAVHHCGQFRHWNGSSAHISLCTMDINWGSSWFHPMVGLSTLKQRILRPAQCELIKQLDIPTSSTHNNCMYTHMRLCIIVEIFWQLLHYP